MRLIGLGTQVRIKRK